jgi:uncharacterized membrane protein (DUF106 family)
MEDVLEMSGRSKRIRAFQQRRKANKKSTDNLIKKLNAGKDPVSAFGFGISHYFEMLHMLIKAMIVLSVINIPLLLYITQYQTVTDKYGGLNIGSLGQADAECLNVKIDNQGISLACTEGYIYNIT